MDSKLRKILTECIRDIETGARDVEDCLKGHPDRIVELRPHLELWQSLNAASKAQPNFGRQQRGQHQLQATLAELDRGEGDKRMIPFLTPALAKVTAAVAATALLIGGAAGASAALGGPDIAGDVLSGIGISKASDTGKEHANHNALQGSENAGQGIDNASQTGRDNADPNALDGAGNAGQGANNASETGSDQANPNAGDGAGNAEDREGNAAGAADDGLDATGDDTDAADDAADDHEDD